jgi:hypothetical protein
VVRKHNRGCATLTRLHVVHGFAAAKKVRGFNAIVGSLTTLCFYNKSGSQTLSPWVLVNLPATEQEILHISFFLVQNELFVLLRLV